MIIINYNYYDQLYQLYVLYSIINVKIMNTKTISP
jgi:hypothetical protein